MTIDEAIVRLEQHIRFLESFNAHEQIEAHKLGIEALKVIQAERRSVTLISDGLLHGEDPG